MKYFFLVVVMTALVIGCDKGDEVAKAVESPKTAVETKITRGTVFEYGIYNPQRKGRVLDSLETNTGKVVRKPVLEFSETTDRIPLVKDTYFAYRYRIINLPKEVAKKPTADLRKVLIHPEMTLPNGSKSTGWDRTFRGRTSVGQVIAFDGYAFNEDYELVEGDWIFQIWFKEQMMVEQKFTTYWPDDTNTGNVNSGEASPEEASTETKAGVPVAENKI